MSQTVLLVGYTGSNTPAEVPSVFAKAGCTVELYCPKNSWLRKNSFYAQWHAAPHEGEAYVRGLLDIVSSGSYAWVVPVDDAVLRMLRDTPAARSWVPVASQYDSAWVGSKAGLSALCTRHGVTTPSYAVYDGTTHMLAAQVGYPLLIKTDQSEAGRGVFFCANESEVTAVLARLSPVQKQSLLFQKYIDGDNIAVEALYKRGRLLAYAHSKIIKTLGGEFGVSVERAYGAVAVPAALLQELGEKFGIDGFVSSTYMHATHGTWHLVEADLRPNAWLPAARLFGVNFAEAVRRWLADEAGEPMTQSGSGPAWHFYRSVRRALPREWAELWAWASNKGGRWRFVPWYDRRFFAATCLQLVDYCVRAPLYRMRSRIIRNRGPRALS